MEKKKEGEETFQSTNALMIHSHSLKDSLWVCFKQHLVTLEYPLDDWLPRSIRVNSCGLFQKLTTPSKEQIQVGTQRKL